MLIWENNEDIKLIECANNRSIIQQQLDASREERRPYIFVTPTMRNIVRLNRILVPVTMLEEEVYKAEICTYLARKTGAHIILMKANDYGSHAQQNINRIITHIKAVSDKINSELSYEVLDGYKNSFKLYKEAVERQTETAHQLLILTASREYGLDDILFGPPERHAIQRSQVPVMLINPRSDLFSLCD